MYIFWLPVECKMSFAFKKIVTCLINSILHVSYNSEKKLD